MEQHYKDIIPADGKDHSQSWHIALYSAMFTAGYVQAKREMRADSKDRSGAI
jgi:hypothetical protein